MLDQDLAAKKAYFEEQDLLELTDDEDGDLRNESFQIMERALEDSVTMPPPTLEKPRSTSFLGPTPKERRAEFEAHAKKLRPSLRESGGFTLVRPSTAPESDVAKSFPVAKPRSGRNISLPDIATVVTIPFYKQMGVIPRELKNGKNVKPADNIKLEPENRQLLKDKIVYFYPNDDISMARRMRIHKVIQLGAAWVNRWRDDVTHIMHDDNDYTYRQLLRHLNRPGLPVGTPLRT